MSPLLPSVQGLLRELEQRPTADFETLETQESIAAYLEAARRPLDRPRGVEVDVVEDLVVGERDVPVRIYQPASEKPLPALVYYHGGGWVVGDLEMHDDTCRMLANEAALHRCQRGLPPGARASDSRSRSTTAGRSCAGPTVTWAIGGGTARARPSGEPPRAATCPPRSPSGPATRACPSTSSSSSTRPSTAPWQPRRGANSREGYFLTAAQMAWYWRQYSEDPEVRRLPEVSPSHSTDLAGLAHSLVVTAEYDLLRDEAEH